MNEMILLGAGASVEAGLQDTKGMTKQMLDMSAEDNSDSRSSRRTHLLRFIVGGLLFQHGVRNENPLTRGINIEAVFNAINLLGQRYEAEFAAFVSSWHPVIEELTRARKVHDDWSETRELEKALGRASEAASRRQPFGADNLSNAIRKMSNSGISTDDKLFESTLSWMTRALIQMVRVGDPNKVNYLIPLLKIDGTEKRVIATLNYNSSVEIAAVKAGISLNLGIDDWIPGSYPHIERGVQLLKLHGSADWELAVTSSTAENPIPQTRLKVHVGDNDRQPPYHPAVNFGGANKLTTRGPFLDLLNAFRNELNQAERLTVIGYSFHDEHINEYISQFLARGSTHLRIINGPDFGKSADGFARGLLETLRRSPEFRERVQDLAMNASDGIQKCFGKD